jgi:hypothetical protein
MRSSVARASLRKQRLSRRERSVFAPVKKIGLALPDVEATIKYDGSPVLKVDNCFMAGLARHASAEPDTLVVRMDMDERSWLLEDAPDVYYVTEFYRKYPLLLVRLSRVTRDALHDLLAVSHRMTLPKTRSRRAPARASRFSA